MSDRQSAPPDRPKRRILGLDGQQRQAQRLTLLLDAALELFGTRGYAKTSIESLCQTAGIGTNSFYELFPNKEAVLIALYDRTTDNMRRAIAEEITTHRDDPGLIKALVSRFVHLTADDPRVARAIFIETAGISSQVDELRRRSRNNIVDTVLAIGRQVRDTNISSEDFDEQARPGPSPRRNAVAVSGAIVETILDWILDPDPDPIEDLIDDITHHCQRVMDAIIEESATIEGSATATPPR